MSAEGDSGPGSREVAYRLFAAEFDDASLSYSESDEERAPNYVVTPTGLRVNRLFAVGVATEIESINEDTLRGRIVDPTGAFVTYAGQYQPEAQAFLDRTTPPAFVAITGKARTFEPEDSDRVFTSVRPESLSEVDADTRDRWVVSAAEATLHRIAVCAAALDSSLRGEELQTALSAAGIDDSLAAGVPRALDHYGTTTAYLEGLRQLAVEALELVADEREEVRPLDLAPGEGGDSALAPLPTVDIDLSDAAEAPATAEPPAEPPAESATESEPEAGPSPESTDEMASTESTDETTTSTESAPAVDSDETTEEAVDAATDASTDETVDTTADETADASDTSPAESTDAEPEPTESAEPTASAESTEATTELTDEPAAEATNGADESAASESTPEPETAAGESTADDETGMYQLDEEEREELESEFDTGFSSGNEVDPAGEADIDVPDIDELAEQAEAEAETGSEETAASADEAGLGDFDDGLGDFEDDAGSADEPAADTESADETGETDEVPDPESEADEQPADEQAAADQPAADVDLEDAVVETMASLDDGDGVDREALVAELIDSYGVEATAVEEAIADALMGGRCYEPADGTLKAI